MSPRPSCRARGRRSRRESTPGLTPDQPSGSTRRPTTRGGFRQIMLAMTLTDYLINAGLIFLIVRQMRDRELDLRSAIMPLVLVFTIGQQYLSTLPTVG